jgi:hypothetical protein
MTEFGSRRRVFMSGQSGQRVGGEQCVPTGRAWTRQEPEQIVVSGMKHDLLVVSDELRAERIFDGTPPSFAALGLAWPERAMILTMPFWLGRSGWAVLVGPFWLGRSGWVAQGGQRGSRTSNDHGFSRTLNDHGFRNAQHPIRFHRSRPRRRFPSGSDALVGCVAPEQFRGFRSSGSNTGTSDRDDGTNVLVKTKPELSNCMSN